MDKKTIIGYGLGQYYESLKELNLLDGKIKFDYFCDRKLEGTGVEVVEGVPVITKNQIKELNNPLVIILIGNDRIVKEIAEEMTRQNIAWKRIHEIIPLEYNITGKELKEKADTGTYRDAMGNSVEFDETIPEALHIQFRGMNNKLVIGANLITSSLYIRMGNSGKCVLGKDSELIEASIFVSQGTVEIGEKCLFSVKIVIRNHDGHHIFDRSSRKRVNYNEDVIIGNQVWICHGVTILRGARIGDGSVVGAGSVVTKALGDHVVVAGVPARVVHKNICWSRDETDYFDRDYFDECVDQSAKEYF